MIEVDPIDLDALTSNSLALTNGRTYRQVLVDARTLIGKHENWTQGAFARDPRGGGVRPKDPGACCWCLLGAVAVSSNPFGLIPPPLMQYLDHYMHELYGDRFSNLGEMNDYIDHEGTLRFLDGALARFQQ
jgi:hypothetical protein